MKKAIIIFLFVLFICDSAYSTETLYCNSKQYLVRVHVNSLGEIADIIVRKNFDEMRIDVSEVELIRFGWENDGFGNGGNFIHLRSNSTGSNKFPFDLNVIETVGTLEIQGKKATCECDWGDK